MIALTDDYQLTQVRKADKIPQGADAWLHGLQGWINHQHRSTAYFLKEARKIHAQVQWFEKLAPEELQSKLQEQRSLFRRRGPHLNSHTPQALALVACAVKHTLGFTPFIEQLAGALVLFDGAIAEMATGEGKTVTAAMAAVLRGWIGLPCHVITANDYLASRDAEIMQPLFDFCLVSVASVTSANPPNQRGALYDQEVVYTTPKELLADFLRDRLALGNRQDARRRQVALLGGNAMPTHTVMRGIHTAIVDEADNVLIDEAITPLIISREEPNEAFVQACHSAIDLALRMEPGVDYQADHTRKAVWLKKDVAQWIAESQEQKPNLFGGLLFQKSLIRQALVAKEFYHRNKQYVVANNEVVIVDESTGRQMPGRSWSAGLHQLVEAKEGLPLTPVKETQARLSFQRFFRFFEVFAGMTGTAWEARREFWHIYNVRVVRIPSHQPSKRKVHALRFYASEQHKWNAILEHIVEIHKQGRPLLVGTRTVERSEWLGEQLKAQGLSCEIVNAVRQKQEAEIIAQAGRLNAITVATNMAGRGTDIKLKNAVHDLGGLHVIATELHGSARVDRQLFGRSARQGDPGSAMPFASLEDDLIKKHLPKVLIGLAHLINGFLPGNSTLLGWILVKLAQRLAHQQDYQSRLSVQSTDTWLGNSLSFARDDVQ